MIKKFLIAFVMITCAFSKATLAIDLNESLELAFKNSPQLVSAQKKLEASDARLGQARSYVLPTLAVNGSVGQNYQQPAVINVPGLGSISTSPDKPADISSYSITLSQMLFNGGAINGMAIAYYQYSSAKEDRRKAMIDVKYKVASNYYGVIKAEKSHSVAEGNVKSLKRYVQQMNVYYNADMATKADVLRIQTQYEGARQMEILARSAEKLAKISFNSQLGLPLTFETEPDLGKMVASSEVPPLENILAIAYKKRPDWLSFKLAQETAKAGLNIAYSGYMPTFMLSGTYGRNIVMYPEEYEASDSNTLSWRALLTGSWTLFDGLNTPNKVYEAQATIDSMKADEKSISDSVALDVTSNYYQLLSTYERVDSARSAEDMARKMMKLAEINFDQRLYTTTQLLDAQTAYHKAQTDLLSVIYDLELGKAQLNKSVGDDIWRTKS